MNVAFRVDASSEIGIGHLMRCLALSEELNKRGHSCFFVTKTDDELIRKIGKNNVHFQIDSNLNLNEDVQALIKFSNERNIDWIVTDHYGINKEYIEKIKEKNFKVLSIDDTAQMHYFSDIVLNQNIGSEKLRYSAEKYTKFLLGPKYVMIRNQLLIKDEKTESSEVKKILITLGGTDEDNLISKIIKSLKQFNDVEFLVIVGPLNPHYENIKKYIDEEGLNIRIVRSPENMASLYLESDIAISAGGSTVYELAYFGIPNIIITLADNQLNIAKELDKQNISEYIGTKNDIDEENLKNKVKELINNDSLRKTMSQKGKKLVDGKGKERIVDFMERFN